MFVKILVFCFKIGRWLDRSCVEFEFTLAKWLLECYYNAFLKEKKIQ